ncbi:hypothetical protein FACS189442_2650 [Spirochaetia bacterium]|nr:hypothetical protein FACS189442_2650 [Spirochaetia bacterium]
MRYHEQLQRLEYCLNTLNITSQNNGNGTFTINNVNIILKGISKINELEYLNPELQAVKSLDYFYNFTGENISLNANSNNGVVSSITSLKTKISGFIKMYRSIINEETELSLQIKLLEDNSLDFIGDELKLFDKIINQLLTHEKINGSYKFSSFDIGSSWVYIILDSVLSLSVIAGVVWSACVVRKKMLEGNFLLESVKQMQIKTESLKDLKDAQAKMLKELTEAEASNILTQNNLEDTGNEYKKRVIYAISELNKMINKGVEIHPALMAPENVQNLFPDYSHLNSIESKTKLLDDK